MIEREWREARDMRQSTATLIAILAAAAFLRFWTLGAGIPYGLGVDEPEIMNRAYRMMRTGDFNPHFFDYPGLYIYVQAAVSVVRFMAGAMSGEWQALKDVSALDFYQWGRFVTAVLGTATVGLVYFIGLRWGTRYALLAAGLMAVMPLHVRESHFILTDVPMTFFVTLTLLLSLRANERARVWAFAAAGAAAGLAAGTKYNGAIALMLPALAAWMTPDVGPSRRVALLATLAAAGAAFLLVAPYTILDLPSFLDGYATLMTSYRRPKYEEPVWLLYAKHLRISLNWVGSFFALAGIGLGLVRAVKGPGRVRWTLTVAFTIVYFWFVSRQALVYGRYVLPMLPFLTLLISAAVISGVSLLRRFSIPRVARTTLIIALTVGVILPPAIDAVNFNIERSKPGTSKLAYDWIRGNLPAGTTFVYESSLLVPPTPPYKTRHVSQLRLQTYDDYLNEGVEYLIASSQSYGPYFEAPQMYRTEYADYMRIFEQSREVARFTPSKDHPGGELRIYKVRP
ncbi:MAG: phospholipid carrier-dependent glycosyltransferase [Vicinamibacterales bacterium]